MDNKHLINTYALAILNTVLQSLRACLPKMTPSKQLFPTQRIRSLRQKENASIAEDEDDQEAEATEITQSGSSCASTRGTPALTLLVMMIIVITRRTLSRNSE